MNLEEGVQLNDLQRDEVGEQILCLGGERKSNERLQEVISATKKYISSS